VLNYVIKVIPRFRKAAPPSVLLLAVITLCLILFNAFIWFQKIYLARDSVYYYQYTSSASLYIPAELPAIIGFAMPCRGELQIKLSSHFCERWTIMSDISLPYSCESLNPSLTLLEGRHNYNISATTIGSEFSFSINIDYQPRENYAQFQNSNPDNYHIISSSIPIGDFDRYPLFSFWGDLDEYEPAEIEQARHILACIPLDFTASTQSQIEEIGSFLIKQLQDREGIPTDFVAAASPWQQYNEIVTGRSKIWCGNYAAIYTFFARVAGIPTRMVGVGGVMDQVKLSGHMFAESYIKESGSWSFVDLTSKKLSVADNRSLLNTLNIFHATLNRRYGSLKARVYVDGKIITIPFSAVSASEEYYFNKDATFIFFRSGGILDRMPLSGLRKILRILFKPDLAYSIHPASAEHKVLVTAFFFLLFLSAVWMIVLGIRYLSQHGP
jgi:hypothetical protein